MTSQNKLTAVSWGTLIVLLDIGNGVLARVPRVRSIEKLPS